MFGVSVGSCCLLGPWFPTSRGLTSRPRRATSATMLGKSCLTKSAARTKISGHRRHNGKLRSFEPQLRSKFGVQPVLGWAKWDSGDTWYNSREYLWFGWAECLSWWFQASLVSNPGMMSHSDWFKWVETINGTAHPNSPECLLAENHGMPQSNSATIDHTCRWKEWVWIFRSRVSSFMPSSTIINLRARPIQIVIGCKEHHHCFESHCSHRGPLMFRLTWDNFPKSLSLSLSPPLFVHNISWNHHQVWNFFW